MLSRSGFELNYQLSAMRNVRIGDLRFPFPSRWRAVRGTQRVSTSNDTGLPAHSEVRIKAEQLFDIHMTPDSSGAVTTHLTIDLGPITLRSEPDWDELGRAYPFTRGFGMVLARSMFQIPVYPWNLRETASALRTQPRSLQMTLFREGYSFDAALRRCRRLNVLLEEGNVIAGLRVVSAPIDWRICVGKESSKVPRRGSCLKNVSS
jgi:hypothetical protein